MAEKYFDRTTFSQESLPKSIDHYNFDNGTYADVVYSLFSSICHSCTYRDVECKPVAQGQDMIGKDGDSALKIEFLQSDDSPPPESCPIRGASIGFYEEGLEVKAKIIDAS